MKQVMIRILIVFAAYWVAILVICFSAGGSYISSKTEEKYLRNIYLYKMINSHHFYVGYENQDSLSFIATTPFNQIDPFHKWYISDVGQIKPDSKLSKKLDSLALQYDAPSNKLK